MCMSGVSSMCTRMGRSSLLLGLVPLRRGRRQRHLCTDPPMPMRKPVVYFHLDPSIDHLDISVDVRIAGKDDGNVAHADDADRHRSHRMAGHRGALRSGLTERIE